MSDPIMDGPATDDLEGTDRDVVDDASERSDLERTEDTDTDTDTEDTKDTP